MGIIEMMTAYPVYSLAVISAIVTLISTLAHKWMTNQEHLTHMKKRQKEIQKELKNCKDEKLLAELNAEMMSIMGVMMKSSFRPMFVTLFPFLILFYFLRGFYAPLIGNSWIWWYIGFSIGTSIIFRKVFNVA